MISSGCYCYVSPGANPSVSIFMPIGFRALKLQDSSAFLQAEVLAKIGGTNLRIIQEFIG
jgi:hypothetical protein